MRSSIRLALLAVGVFFSLASATRRNYSNAPPPPPPPGQTVGVSQPPAPAGAPTGTYYCHNEQSELSGASICRPTYKAGEQERLAAAQQGLTTTFCHQDSPVACFTMSNGSEWCSLTLDDCEAWRLIDAERSNTQPAACALMH